MSVQQKQLFTELENSDKLNSRKVVIGKDTFRIYDLDVWEPKQILNE